MEEQQNLTWLGQLQYQAGVVSRQQALDAGFTGKAIEWRLRTGAWRRVYHGVYATFTGKLSREARLWAVVLRLGAGAVLSHETAAEIQHLTDKPSRLIRISVPKEQHPGRHTKDQGRSYPQIAGAGCGMAATVASAADQRRGHRARPDRRSADLRRCLQLDLGRCRPPPRKQGPGQEAEGR